MGPVAGALQHNDVTAAVRQAVSDGARLAAGSDAGALPADGYFVRPTVLEGVTADMPAFRDEIFGPVLAVCEFDTLDDALVLANNSIYGLSSAIYTTSASIAEAYVDGIEAGSPT